MILQTKETRKAPPRGGADPVIIVFLGLGRPLADVVAKGGQLRDRQHCIAAGLASHSQVERIVVVTTVPRAELFAKILRRHKLMTNASGSRQCDVYIGQVLPQRWWTPGSRTINRLLKRLLFRWQVGGLQSRRTVVWGYLHSSYPVLCELGLSYPYILDADYNFIEDPHRDRSDEPAFSDLLSAISRRATCVVAGSRSVLRLFENHGMNNLALIRNGIRLERFGGVPEIPPDLNQIPHPRVGYVGAISRWMDIELLVGLARRRPDWNFPVIGAPYKNPDLSVVTQCPNVHLIGERPPDQVPAYLSGFDAALSLYPKETSTWLDGDSMKIYEYLAAGVMPICSPFHSQLQDDFEGLLYLATDPVSFEEQILRVLQLSAEARTDWQRRCRLFLERNTWDTRTEEVMGCIQKVLRK